MAARVRIVLCSLLCSLAMVPGQDMSPSCGLSHFAIRESGKISCSVHTNISPCSCDLHSDLESDEVMLDQDKPHLRSSWSGTQRVHGQLCSKSHGRPTGTPYCDMDIVCGLNLYGSLTLVPPVLNGGVFLTLASEFGMVTFEAKSNHRL
jgi:hypothetical protein